jgi:hypothetical protein
MSQRLIVEFYESTEAENDRNSSGFYCGMTKSCRLSSRQTPGLARVGMDVIMSIL